MIYLDSAATTPMAECILDAMLSWLSQDFANPGSVYKAGRKAKEAIEDARVKMARLFNAKPENIIFTSGGSEGNSFAFQDAAHRLRDTNRKHIIVSSVEHDSVLRAAEALIKDGFYITYLPVCEGGSVLIEQFINALTPETGLVSVMYVNNETGAINLIEDIGQICNDRGILFHTDCVQAAGFLPIDVEQIGCDYANVSAHKFHGPKGVGCLYIKNPEKSSPLVHGGHGQEFGLRGGTENVAGIVAAGEAADMAMYTLHDSQEMIWKHRIKFWELIRGPLNGIVRLNGQWLEPSKILNIYVDGVDGDTLVLAMDTCGVCISAGSACRSMDLVPSKTLLAMGLTEDEARSSVRISFSAMNTEEEVAAAAHKFITCVNVLRGECFDL